MTAPTTTPSEPGFYRTLERLHGHRCPMSILGARLGFAARGALEAVAPAGAKLGARYHSRTCALDGIQVTTGCTLGGGNIEVDPAGEHRLELWAAGRAGSVEAWLTDYALDKGKVYADLKARAQALREGCPERREIELEMARILESLETAPDSDLAGLEVRGA